MRKTTEYEIDLANPPALTAAQVAELQALKKMPESAIDYSDIPALDESILEGCRPKPVLQANKNIALRCELILMCCSGFADKAKATSRESTPFFGERCWSLSSLRQQNKRNHSIAFVPCSGC